MMTNEAPINHHYRYVQLTFLSTNVDIWHEQYSNMPGMLTLSHSFVSFLRNRSEDLFESHLRAEKAINYRQILYIAHIPK